MKDVCTLLFTFYPVYTYTAMAETIKFITNNYQGLNTTSKRKDILNFYKMYNSKNYFIVCLQDSHFTSDREPFIGSQWGYKYVSTLAHQTQEVLLCYLIYTCNNFDSNPRSCLSLLNFKHRFRF